MNNTELTTFTTEDMTLVTVLKLRGVEPVKLERSNGGCRWLYRHTATLEQIFDEYSADEAFVEPREFARKMGLVRSGMYKFLNHTPSRVRN